MVTLNHKSISLLLPNCNFAVVMNQDVNIVGDRVLGGVRTEVATHRLRMTVFGV